jgi:tetratricopeptide (TPR) repeat protein
MQCHPEGKVAIERPGRHAYDFQPGDSLSDYIRYYLLAGGRADGLRGVSQVEALTQSTCKRKSGDTMSCTSCHDPHSEPPTEDRVAYYREKCLECHGNHFAAKRHPTQPNCTRCHMPGVASTDVAHTQVTDHRIEAESGHLREAAELWQRAFRRAPGRSSLGMNLLTAFCDARQFDKARTTVLRVLEFNPDMTAAKHALQALNRTPNCSP